MKTAGSILREARIKKNISFETVEQATKIRKKFLEAIESDDFSSLPSISYAKGFVKNYSEYLGLDSENVLAFFRRQNVEAPRSSLLPKGVAEPLNASVFRLTPSRFMAICIGVLVCLFILYFAFQYKKIQLPPKLLISAPAQDAKVVGKRVDIIGETDPDATTTINGITTLVRSDGKFFDSVTLTSGVNTITIQVTSRFGKTASEKRTVTTE